MTFLLVVIYVVFISLGLPDSLFGVAWPVAHLDFGINENFASFYSIITGVCTGGVSFIAGKVIRKFGTATVTFVSTLLTVCGLVCMSFAPNIVVMMLGAVILGYGAGVIDTGLNNFVSLNFKARHMNWLHAFWGIGVTISPLIMSWALSGDNNSWRTAYRVIAIIQFIIALFVLSSIKTWRKIEEKSICNDEEKTKENKSFFELIKIKGVLTSVLSQGLYCSMEFLIGTWGASFLVNAHGALPEEASKWVSLYYGGIMLGRIISGFISDKFGDNNMIRGGIAVSFLGMILLVLPLGNASFIGLLLIGIGFGPIFPSVLHSVPERFGIEYSADITGFHMGGAYGIGFAIQLTFGFIATATTFAITPFVLISLCILLLITHETTIKTLKRK